jgi:RNA recognition motif-containing protein
MFSPKNGLFQIIKTKGVSMNIYIGNLPSDATESDLRKLFESFGQIESATLVKDRFSGESRGFGFVDMPSRKEAVAAIAGLNGKNVKGQSIKVNEARPRNTDRRGDRGRRRY